MVDNKTGLANSLSVSYLLNFPDLHIKIQAQIAFNCSDFSPSNQRQIYKEFQIGKRNEFFSNQFRAGLSPESPNPPHSEHNLSDKTCNNKQAGR